jgi:hypothetical protein
MPCWIPRRGIPATIAAPIHEPATAAAMSSASVANSTSTMTV